MAATVPSDTHKGLTVGRHLRTEHDQQILALHRDGLTYADIAKELDLHSNQIARVLKRHNAQGLRTGGAAKKLVQCEVDQVIQMVCRGVHLSEISKHFGVCVTTICAIINQYGGRRTILRNHKETQ